MVLVGLFSLGIAISFGLGEIVQLIGQLEPFVGTLGELKYRTCLLNWEVSMPFTLLIPVGCI